MASGSSLDELLNAKFKEAFNEFDKVGRGFVFDKHLQHMSRPSAYKFLFSDVIEGF